MKKDKNKQWLDKHSRTEYLKAIKRKRKRKRKSKHSKKSTNIGIKLQNNLRKGNRVAVIAPEKFSIIYNPEETLSFFKKLDCQVNRGMPVLMNMSKVKILTIDAIMYFLAIIKSYREIKSLGYSFEGKYPQDDQCRFLMKSSGFLKFAKSTKTDIEPSSDLIKIKNGDIADTEIAKRICDLVISNFELTKKDTTKLYRTIIELMLNTKQHAYYNLKNMLNEWYIFVRTLSNEKKIEFIFLDTGTGIPNTIRKTKIEKAQEWLSKLNINLNSYSEWQLIDSTLKGAYRSRTGDEYRGKGLPYIQLTREEHYIQNFKIVSNCGYISEFENKDINNCFNGTLFYWELDKEYFNEKNKNCN